MDRMYVVWIDANGFTRLTLVNTSSGAASILTAMLALSNADMLNTAESALTINPSPLPTAAKYQRTSDCASLLFIDGSGSETNLQLPAPKASVFLSDQETVDSTAIASLITACVGSLMTTAGGVVTAYVGGVRKPTTREGYQ